MAHNDTTEAPTMNNTEKNPLRHPSDDDDSRYELGSPTPCCAGRRVRYYDLPWLERYDKCRSCQG